MKKLILKFNAKVADDPMRKVEKWTKELGLRIDSVEEVKKSPGTSLKIVCVIGAAEGLEKMDKRLIRVASISRKSA